MRTLESVFWLPRGSSAFMAAKTLNCAKCDMSRSRHLHYMPMAAWRSPAPTINVLFKESASYSVGIKRCPSCKLSQTQWLLLELPLSLVLQGCCVRPLGHQSSSGACGRQRIAITPMAAATRACRLATAAPSTCNTISIAGTRPATRSRPRRRRRLWSWRLCGLLSRGLCGCGLLSRRRHGLRTWRLRGLLSWWRRRGHNSVALGLWAISCSPQSDTPSQVVISAPSVDTAIELRNACPHRVRCGRWSGNWRGNRCWRYRRGNWHRRGWRRCGLWSWRRCRSWSRRWRRGGFPVPPDLGIHTVHKDFVFPVAIATRPSTIHRPIG